MKSKSQSKIGKEWLKGATRPYFGVVCFLTALTITVTLLTLAFAYLVRYLINSASSGEEKLLWIFAGVLLGVLLLKIVLKTLEGYLAECIRAKMYVRLRKDTFSKILRADYTHLQSYHSGELLNRMSTDVQEICIDTVGLTPTVCGMLVQCLGAIVALLTIDPLFTAIYVVCGGVFGGITALFRRQIKRRQKDMLEADGKVRSFAQEGLSSVMTVKAYCAEEKTSDKLDSLSKTYYEKRMKRNVLYAQMSFVFTLLSNFGLIFAVVWCSVSVLKGNTDYGSILSVILLLMQLQQPLASFSTVLPVYYSRAASAERLAELSNLPTENRVGEERSVSYEDLRAICLENVAFSYDRDRIFQGANARIEKGQIVCLTGPSGAGKSTVFKLLLNVFQPKEGQILLEENQAFPLNVRDRDLFAYVPQGNFLFSGTIYENLTFFMGAESTPTEEEIKSALEVACAEFVYTLPQGLQTKLNEGGEGLSEGQLQRLNVARAILSNRPILLLDEATSALDGETEERLLKNIRALKNKTCLIVTHRPAALAIADKVLRVEEGVITEISK